MSNYSEEDSPFVNVFSIEDKSFVLSDAFIKKDEIRFDEPKAKTKDRVPYGSMDLGIDPDDNNKVDPGETILPKENNTETPDDALNVKVKKKSVLAFGEPEDSAPEYVDPRIPKIRKKVIKLSPRTRDDL
jgi:hypothetical protein